MTDVVDRVVAAINARDIESFVACYAEDATIEDGYDRVGIRGRDELRERYVAMFDRFPRSTSSRAGGRVSATSSSRRRRSRGEAITRGTSPSISSMTG